MRTALLAVVVLSLPFSSFSNAHAQARPADLAGTWQLRPEQSDSVESLEPDAARKAPRPPGVGNRRPAGVPGGFGLPRGFDPQLMREALAAVRHPARQIAISLNADTLTLVLDGAAPYALILNGRKVKRVWIDGADAEIRASLRDGAVRIERKHDNDLKFTETYALDPASGFLSITTEVDGPISRTIELRRIYERAATGG